LPGFDLDAMDGCWLIDLGRELLRVWSNSPGSQAESGCPPAGGDRTDWVAAGSRRAWIMTPV